MKTVGARHGQAQNQTKDGGGLTMVADVDCVVDNMKLVTRDDTIFPAGGSDSAKAE